MSDKVADILRLAILNGEFKPGDMLNETDLAEQLGISRGPIREAFRVLNTEGLVKTVPYHGTRVRTFTRQDIEELYSMRVMMETFAVQRIIENNKQVEVAGLLRERYEQMVIAAQAGDFQKLNEVDRGLHDALIEQSDHHLMISLWQIIAMRMQQIMAINNRRFSDMNEIADNHLQIIEKIEAGETEAASELLRDHIVSAGVMLVESCQIVDDDEEASLK